MKRLSISIPFEEWIARVFGPDPDEMDLELEPAMSVDYVTKLFEQAPRVLMSYSEAQIAEGFWFLVSARSSYMYELLNPDVPWSERKRGISSIFTLFEQFFSQRCSPRQHRDESGPNPLNTICYMWWDSLPIGGAPDDPSRVEIDEAFLDVMGRLLDLPSVNCQESALHGLGHWHLSHPQRVAALIESFLDRHVDLQAGLEEYALDAREGCVQ